jgi:nucleobase:cation symporter-1, NCS1 family
VRTWYHPILGVAFAFALALGGALTDPVADLPKILPDWYLVPFLLAAVLGSVANNVPNGYTAGLGLLALRLLIGRVASLSLIAMTLIFRAFTLYYGHSLDLYQRWLGYVLTRRGYW